jgi:two-component system chemotaxis response regulator CheY
VNQRVLLVEDSATMRAFVIATLEAEGGYEVIEARNGFEALRLLTRGPYQLVITDINMPDINGLEMIRYVKGSPQHQRTPLIIISTEGRDRDRERGLELGANEYLVKPFAPEALMDAVRRLLGA